MIKFTPDFSNIIEKPIRKRGRKPKSELPTIEQFVMPKSNLSDNAIFYIRRLEDKIEKFWKEANKDKSKQTTPEFIAKLGQGTITVKPIYGNASYGKDLMISVTENNGSVDKFILNRALPDNFRYEQVVKTNYGSRSAKSYNNNKDKKNPEIITKLNDIIVNYFPKILSKESNL